MKNLKERIYSQLRIIANYFAEIAAENNYTSFEYEFKFIPASSIFTIKSISGEWNSGIYIIQFILEETNEPCSLYCFNSYNPYMPICRFRKNRLVFNPDWQKYLTYLCKYNPKMLATIYEILDVIINQTVMIYG